MRAVIYARYSDSAQREESVHFITGADNTFLQVPLSRPHMP